MINYKKYIKQLHIFFGGLVIKKNSNASTEQVNYNALLLSAAILSTLSCIFNILEHEFFPLIILTTATSLVLTGLFLLSRFGNLYNIWLFIITVMLILSVCWFMNGGTIGSVSYLYLLTLVLFITISKRSQQNLIFGLFLLNLAIIYLLEYYWGDKIVHPYETEYMHYSDMVFVFILVLFVTFFIIRFVKRAYDRERHKVLLQKEIIEKQNQILAEKTKDLELANEQRTNTFINLAHETKTPLTLINNYLEEYIQKNKQTEELKVIKSNIEKLTQDIVNFFDMERIQKGLNVYDNDQIADFSKMLRDHMILFKQYGSKKNIEITESIESDVFVKADPESLYRIVNNLIENAIKYTDANGRIEVSLKGIGDKIKFSVKDNGIGIPPHLHSKIFDPYYQVHSEKKNYQGMGMGLSIVKKIIDSLNGEIIIISDPQKNAGTEITVQLPIHKIIDGEIISEFKNTNAYYFESEQLNIKEEEFDEKKPAIMVVEDNIPLLNYMFSKLKEKYNIHYALNGNEALEKLKTIKQLDLIVSDVMMDNGDGFDFYKGVSEQKRLGHIPFIFLTAKTNMEDKMRGIKLGAIDYISKPFLFNELTGKIDSILNNLSEQREALIHHSFKTLLHQSEPGTIHSSNHNTFASNCDKFNLTAREKEIVQLIAKGQTYKEIANTLNISDKTVGKHIQNMFEKVGASNKTELVNMLGAALSV